MLLHTIKNVDVNVPDKAGMTPIMWAAYHNKPQHVRKLMQLGADLEEKDVDGKTPMHWVSRWLCCLGTE